MSPKLLSQQIRKPYKLLPPCKEYNSFILLRPPSVYNISKEDTYTDRTLTSFYLPPATAKGIPTWLSRSIVFACSCLPTYYGSNQFVLEIKDTLQCNL